MSSREGYPWQASSSFWRPGCWTPFGVVTDKTDDERAITYIFNDLAVIEQVALEEENKWAQALARIDRAVADAKSECRCPDLLNGHHAGCPYHKASK